MKLSAARAVVVVDKANKLVQCFLVLRNREGANCLNTSQMGSDAISVNGMAQEIHFGLSKLTLCGVHD